jgi:hypothetical protein
MAWAKSDPTARDLVMGAYGEWLKARHRPAGPPGVLGVLGDLLEDRQDALLQDVRELVGALMVDPPFCSVQEPRPMSLGRWWHISIRFVAGPRRPVALRIAWEIYPTAPAHVCNFIPVRGGETVTLSCGEHARWRAEGIRLRLIAALLRINMRRVELEYHLLMGENDELAAACLGFPRLPRELHREMQVRDADRYRRLCRLHVDQERNGRGASIRQHEVYLMSR